MSEINVSQISPSQAAEIIRQHQKFMDEFSQMLDEEETSISAWWRYMEQPNAYLALGAAIQYYDGEHAAYVARIFLTVFKDALHIMEFKSSKIEELKTALAFYADAENYAFVDTTSKVDVDQGEKARKALRL